MPAGFCSASGASSWNLANCKWERLSAMPLWKPEICSALTVRISWRHFKVKALTKTIISADLEVRLLIKWTTDWLSHLSKTFLFLKWLPYMKMETKIWRSSKSVISAFCNPLIRPSWTNPVALKVCPETLVRCSRTVCKQAQISIWRSSILEYGNPIESLRK